MLFYLHPSCILENVKYSTNKVNFSVIHSNHFSIIFLVRNDFNFIEYYSWSKNVYISKEVFGISYI